MAQPPRLIGAENADDCKIIKVLAQSWPIFGSNATSATGALDCVWSGWVRNVTIRRRNWLTKRFGWIVCRIAGHQPSQRRKYVRPDGGYGTVCRRCEIRMNRRDQKWQVELSDRN
jgi:hypothetical protein